MAELEASVSLAAFKIKAEIERDMRWAGHPLDHTKKDEYLMLLWSIPLIGLFIPGLREVMQEGFEAMRHLHKDAPQYFMYGWAVIFCATFGVKQALGFILPGRQAALLQSMGPGVQVPEAAARWATNRGAGYDQPFGNLH